MRLIHRLLVALDGESLDSGVCCCMAKFNGACCCYDKLEDDDIGRKYNMHGSDQKHKLTFHTNV
jgi:hypothetical protein